MTSAKTLLPNKLIFQGSRRIWIFETCCSLYCTGLLLSSAYPQCLVGVYNCYSKCLLNWIDLILNRSVLKPHKDGIRDRMDWFSGLLLLWTLAKDTSCLRLMEHACSLWPFWVLQVLGCFLAGLPGEYKVRKERKWQGTRQSASGASPQNFSLFSQ